MKPGTPKTLATMLLLMLLCAGCQTAPRPFPVSAEDNSKRLIQRPDFQKAAQAAPDWVKDALRTITRLETEKANRAP